MPQNRSIKRNLPVVADLTPCSGASSRSRLGLGARRLSGCRRLFNGVLKFAIPRDVRHALILLNAEDYARLNWDFLGWHVLQLRVALLPIKDAGRRDTSRHFKVAAHRRTPHMCKTPPFASDRQTRTTVGSDQDRSPQGYGNAVMVYSSTTLSCIISTFYINHDF